MSENNKNIHINDQRIRELTRKGVTVHEDMICMEHIENCDFCFQRYIASMEENLLTLPVNFKEEVIGKAVKLKPVELFSKFKFYGYCLRVSLACACSILLLFSIDSFKISSIGSIMKQVKKEDVIFFQEKFESFNKYFNNLEVNLNEKEKE